MSLVPRTSRELSDLVRQVIKYNEFKGAKIIKADRKENEEKIKAQREISEKYHSGMRNPQLYPIQTILGEKIPSGGKKKSTKRKKNISGKPKKPKNKQKSKAAKPNKK